MICSHISMQYISFDKEQKKNIFQLSHYWHYQGASLISSSFYREKWLTRIPIQVLVLYQLYAIESQSVQFYRI